MAVSAATDNYNVQLMFRLFKDVKCLWLTLLLEQTQITQTE